MVVTAAGRTASTHRAGCATLRLWFALTALLLVGCSTPTGRSEPATSTTLGTKADPTETVVVAVETNDAEDQAVVLYSRLNSRNGKVGLASFDPADGSAGPPLTWPEERMGGLELIQRGTTALLQLRTAGGRSVYYEAALAGAGEVAFSPISIDEHLRAVPYGEGGWRVDGDGRATLVTAEGAIGPSLDTNATIDDIKPLVEEAGVAVWDASSGSWRVYRTDQDPFTLPAQPRTTRRVLAGRLLTERCPPTGSCILSMGIPGDESLWTITAPDWWHSNESPGTSLTLVGPTGQLFQAVGSFEEGWQVWFLDQEGRTDNKSFDLGPGHIDIAFNQCDDIVALASTALSAAPSVFGIYDPTTSSFLRFESTEPSAGGLAFVLPSRCDP